MLPGVKGSLVSIEAMIEVIGVNAFNPPVAHLLVNRAPCEIQPRLVEVIAEPVYAGLPDQDRGGVGHRAESPIAFTQGFFSPLALRYFIPQFLNYLKIN
jgi:hypothetical protein